MADFSYSSYSSYSSYAGQQPEDQSALRAGDLELDETRWTVHRAGRQVDLSPTEFRLLACMMRHQGQVLTREQLLESVWGWNRGCHSQIVETYVSYLRRKLESLGPRLIHTKRGVGYLFRAEVTSAVPYRDESARLP
jgi:two-component system, OmpR family, response regulator